MNVPKLRFPEFNSDWNETTLKNIATINPKNETLPDKFIYIDLESVNKGILSQEKIISKSNAPSRAQRIIKKNDILFQTVRPYQQNNYFVEEIKELPYVASTGYALIRTNEDSYFVYSLLHKKDFLDKVIDRCTGTSFPAISSNDLGEININIPDIQEQTKISNFLSLLDKKIELQTKKIEALKLFKKSQIKEILRKIAGNIFSLKDLGYFITGNSIGKDKIIDKGVPVILYGDLFTKYGEEINTVTKFIKDNKKYIKSEVGDILFPTSTTVDAISLISPSVINIPNVVYGGDLLIYKCNKNLVNPNFLSYQINHFKNLEFSKKAQGSTIIHIHANDLLNSQVKIPSIKNQRVISNFGKSINRKIELELLKLNKIQQIKKGLLQKMFV